MRRLVAFTCLAFLGFLSAQTPRSHVCYAVAQDAIVNPVLKDFLRRAIETAQRDGAECLVVQITTPGGTVDAMQEIVRMFLQSPVPVVTYVAPIASNADSAGAFIVMAGHIAAMAPGSRIGAAHPVLLPIGGGEQGPSEAERIMTKKATQAVAATIKAIAELRGRNPKVAERMVRESLSLTAREAVEQKIVDLVADDLNDLLRKIDGRAVKTMAGIKTLHTRNAQVHEIRMSNMGKASLTPARTSMRWERPSISP